MAERVTVDPFGPEIDGRLYSQGTPKGAWLQCWQLMWADAASQKHLLTALRPYLITKRQLAEIALALLETPVIAGRTSPEVRFRRHQLYDQYTQLKKASNGA